MIGLIIGITSVVAWLIWSNAFYQVKEGFAFIRWGLGGDKVYFRGSFFAYPIIHRVEKIDLREQRVLISLLGEENAITKDRIRVNLQLSFLVQVRHSNWSILSVARRYGEKNVIEKDTLKEVFEAKFVHAIKQLIKTYTYQDLSEMPNRFKKELKNALEVDFGGYELNKIRIAALKYMPLDEYDIDHNILDAEGYENLKKWLEENKKAS